MLNKVYFSFKKWSTIEGGTKPQRSLNELQKQLRCKSVLLHQHWPSFSFPLFCLLKPNMTWYDTHTLDALVNESFRFDWVNHVKVTMRATLPLQWTRNTVQTFYVEFQQKNNRTLGLVKAPSYWGPVLCKTFVFFVKAVWMPCFYWRLKRST